MNKGKVQDKEKARKTGTPFFKKGVKDVAIMGALALILVVCVWRIFHTEENSLARSVSSTESERKVSQLLEQIEGVGEADVMICETEDGVQSVVVVCEGANDLQTVMDIREAVAAALGTQEQSVKIYLKK